MRRARRCRRYDRADSLLVVHLGAVGHDLLELVAVVLGRPIFSRDGVLVLLVRVDRLFAHACPLPPTPGATTARRCATSRRASSRRRARVGSAPRSGGRTRAGCWGSRRRRAPSPATPRAEARAGAAAQPTGR